MQRSILAKRVGPALLAAIVFAYLYGLGAAPLLGADEPRYAQVGREMFTRRDLVTPTLNGRHWFEKPALPYWLMHAAFGLFGVNEFSARLGASLSGLFVILLLWRLAARVESEETARLDGFGLTCAAVAGSCAGLLVFSKTTGFDAPLTAAVTLALTSFFLWQSDDGDSNQRRLYLAGFYAGIGVALLAKGLVGVVIPLAVVGLYYLLVRQMPQLGRLGLWWGVPLVFAVAGLWYGPVMLRHGREFVDEFFIGHHFARYVSNRYRHPQPFYFYIPITAMLALPWTFFLGAGVWKVKGWRLPAATLEQRLSAFSIAWLAAPVVFFSFSGSKLPGYILPALPGGILLAGFALHSYLRGEAGLWLMRATGVLALCGGAAALVFADRSGIVSMKAALAITLPAIGLGAICTFFPRWRTLCAASTVVGTLLTFVLIASLALEPFARHESVKGLLEAADKRGLGDASVVEMHTIERSAEFYAAGRLMYGADGQPVKLEGAWQAVETAREAGGRVLVLIPVEYVGQFDLLPSDVRRELIAENGVHALMLLELKGT